MIPDKNTLRKQILEKRALLTPDILNKAGKAAAEKLFSMEEYINANTVMLYMDFRNEVPTGSILDRIFASEKKLVLPLTDKTFHIIPYEIPKEGKLADYLSISKYGIPEPNPTLCAEVDIEEIDLIIVPGSAFDQYKNRMGYGKGCYDSFFSGFPKPVFKLALAYDFQILPCIPTESTDVKMDKILSIETVE